MKKSNFHRGEHSPRDHYADVTAKIIAALDAGVPPWRCQWDKTKAGGPMMPQNATTGARYRGINTLILGGSMMAFANGDPRWATYKQAAEQGWQVQAGSRGTTGYFYKRLEVDGGDGEDGRFIPMLRSFTLFHASQIDGIPSYMPPSIEEAPWREPEAAAIIADNSGAVIHIGGDRAFYSPSTDHIVIAHLGNRWRFGVPPSVRRRRWLTRSRATRFNIGVTPEIDLAKLTVAEKDALILSLLPLVGQLEAALARIAELEARLEKPPKTPDNSSLPPSKGQKSDDQPSGEKPPRKSRPGFGRALDPHPDRIVDRRLDACPHCAAAWTAEPQTPHQVYDRIELPPVRPDVTRVRLFGGRCACCGERAVATAPEGLEPGSPFGKSIEAIAVYLHYAQAISIERLRCLFAEMFSLSISEGALCNILARAQAPLEAAASAIAAAVTASDVVASDETSVRVMKKTQWEWVFVTALYVLHIIRPSRGAAVVRALFGGHRPRVWISDSFGAQRGHSEFWQMCLAHLLRDTQFAIDCGDDGFSPAFIAPQRSAGGLGSRRTRSWGRRTACTCRPGRLQSARDARAREDRDRGPWHIQRHRRDLAANRYARDHHGVCHRLERDAEGPKRRYRRRGAYDCGCAVWLSSVQISRRCLRIENKWTARLHLR